MSTINHTRGRAITVRRYASVDQDAVALLASSVIELCDHVLALETRVAEHGGVAAPESHTDRAGRRVDEGAPGRAGAGVDWNVIADNMQAAYNSTGPAPEDCELAAARAAVAAYLAQQPATGPHTPRTLPEQVLAEGIGEPQTQPVAAVAPGDLGGIFNFCVWYAPDDDEGTGGWIGKAVYEDTGDGWALDTWHPTPELAFADLCEKARQRAHAANLTEARREPPTARRAGHWDRIVGGAA